MDTKIYISLIGQSHYTTITIGNKDKRIHFSGAERDENGTYTTGNIAEQKGIEESKGFGKKFKLLKVLDDNPKAETPMIGPGVLVNGVLDAEALIKNNMSAVVSPLLDAIKDTPEKEADPIKAGLQQISFRNIIQAQEYFGKEPYKVPKSKIRTQPEIQAKGVEFGFNVIFSKD